MIYINGNSLGFFDAIVQHAELTQSNKKYVIVALPVGEENNCTYRVIRKLSPFVYFIHKLLGRTPYRKTDKVKLTENLTNRMEYLETELSNLTDEKIVVLVHHILSLSKKLNITGDKKISVMQNVNNINSALLSRLNDRCRKIAANMKCPDHPDKVVDMNSLLNFEKEFLELSKHMHTEQQAEIGKIRNYIKFLLAQKAETQPVMRRLKEKPLDGLHRIRKQFLALCEEHQLFPYAPAQSALHKINSAIINAYKQNLLPPQVEKLSSAELESMKKEIQALSTDLNINTFPDLPNKVLELLDLVDDQELLRDVHELPSTSHRENKQPSGPGLMKRVGLRRSMSFHKSLNKSSIPEDTKKPDNRESKLDRSRSLHRSSKLTKSTSAPSSPKKAIRPLLRSMSFNKSLNKSSMPEDAQKPGNHGSKLRRSLSLGRSPKKAARTPLKSSSVYKPHTDHPTVDRSFEEEKQRLQAQYESDQEWIEKSQQRFDKLKNGGKTEPKSTHMSPTKALRKTFSLRRKSNTPTPTPTPRGKLISAESWDRLDNSFDSIKNKTSTEKKQKSSPSTQTVSKKPSARKTSKSAEPVLATKTKESKKVQKKLSPKKLLKKVVPSGRKNKTQNKR